MTVPGYNEADTRAKLIDPALHSRGWVELVRKEERDRHGVIYREQSAVRVTVSDSAVRQSTTA